MRILLTALLLGGILSPLSTQAQTVTITEIVRGLKEPWGVAILPDGAALITERGGNLLVVKDGQKRKVNGVPKVWAKGQGGLLDVTLPRDFAQTREVFLTYSKRQGRGAGTALAVGRLSDDASKLENLRDLFVSAPNSDTTRHFGSRVVEAQDGTLFITMGDRGIRPSAQDRATHNGSILRINRDGSVPGSNPFVNASGSQPEIWSYGHRNPQGAALDAKGNLWTAEHGAKGGDEVNLIRKGANYGWPVISYGEHYSGKKIGEGTSKAGMEQPKLYWDPSIAPSGLLVYSGKLWPEWKGDIFVGSLKFDYIARLDGSPLREVQQIKTQQTKRVRDIIEAPDGSIWFLSVDKRALYRLTP